MLELFCLFILNPYFDPFSHIWPSASIRLIKSNDFDKRSKILTETSAMYFWQNMNLYVPCVWTSLIWVRWFDVRLGQVSYNDQDGQKKFAYIKSDQKWLKNDHFSTFNKVQSKSLMHCVTKNVANSKISFNLINLINESMI